MLAQVSQLRMYAQDLSRKLLANAEYAALDFSVLNHLGAEKTFSETIDYICPLNSMRSFVENKIRVRI